MQTDTRRPIALVTGGSRGIGRAIVEALAREGWQVYFCSQGTESAATTSQELAQLFPGQISGRVCDVGRQSQVDDLVSWVTSEAGRIDCLVNNAGIGHFGPVDEISGEEWRRLIRTNLNGTFYTIRAVTPWMKKQGEGWIINIASLAGKNPFAGGSAYNASKFGMVGLSEASMLDLRRFGIRVAAILPGSVQTEFSHPKPGASDDWKLAPEDIARTVLDLLRHEGRSLPSLVEIRPSNPPKR